MTIFAHDLGFPEAPLLLPDGGFLFVEMSPEKGCVARIDADGGSRRVLAKTGRPNGLARDRHGAIWVAETEQRAVLKMSLDGRYETFATRSSDEPFIFLNDLTFAPSGELYVTDSGIAINDIVPNGELVPNWRDLTYDGRVYRINTQTARARRAQGTGRDEVRCRWQAVRMRVWPRRCDSTRARRSSCRSHQDRGSALYKSGIQRHEYLRD
jgi:gluconolactonase